MGFKIAARTLLHLGSELISSDGIALYELIKNSYDAGSPMVRVTVMAALPRSVQSAFLSSSGDGIEYRTKEHARKNQLTAEFLVEQRLEDIACEIDVNTVVDF